MHSNPGPGLQSSPFYTTLLAQSQIFLSPGLPACSPAEGAASPTLHGDSLWAQGKHSPVCRASSSPPPHLLTETRLLLFLTLQLPLAWGSPLYPHPLAPTRWHHSVILRDFYNLKAPEGAADAPDVQVCGASKTSRLQPKSPNSPTPTLSEPVPPSLPCSCPPSQRLQKGNRTSGPKATVGKRSGLLGSSSAGS